MMAYSNFDGILYRCHEGDHFSGWWCQNRYDNLSTQKTLQHLRIQNHMLLYV